MTINELIHCLVHQENFNVINISFEKIILKKKLFTADSESIERNPKFLILRLYPKKLKIAIKKTVSFEFEEMSADFKIFKILLLLFLI